MPTTNYINVINISSHLAMVLRLSATERPPYLKGSVLCPSEPNTRPTLAKHKNTEYTQSSPGTAQHSVSPMEGILIIRYHLKPMKTNDLVISSLSWSLVPVCLEKAISLNKCWNGTM